MAANIALSLALLGGFLVLGITTAPVSKFTSQTVKASTFVASDTKVRLITYQKTAINLARNQSKGYSFKIYPPDCTESDVLRHPVRQALERHVQRVLMVLGRLVLLLRPVYS